MTDTNNKEFVKALREIDKEFLPITFDHKEDINDHIEDLLDLFIEKFKGVASSSPLPIKCFVPVFNKIAKWDSQGIDDAPFEDLYCLTDNFNLYQDVFSIQSAISKKSKTHFSETAVSHFNKQLDSQVIRIKIDDGYFEDEIEYSKTKDPLILGCNIKKSLYEELRKKYIDNLEEVDEGELDYGPLDMEDEASLDNYSDTDFEKKEDSESFEERLKPSIKHHALYLDEDHQLYYFFSNTIQKKEGDQVKVLGLGGLFVLINDEYCDKEVEDKFVPLLQSITNKLSNRIIHHYQIEENLKQTRKAAISQVFARNGSHNIGSHVLSRIINKEQVQTLRKNEEERQYLGNQNGNSPFTFNEKLAYFNSYLKSRMDFLADIATGTPTMESSKSFAGELLAGLDKNRILLDKISGITNFKYQILLHDCRNYNNSNGHNSTTNCMEKIASEDDFDVAIPNDILGQHAFYIIIENLIRNTAKHSYSGKDDDLVNFHIEIREPDEDICRDCPELKSYYEVQVYDDIPHYIKVRENENILVSQERIEKFEDISLESLEIVKNNSLERLVYNQNRNIDKNVLNKDNKLRQGAWGMIEMKACASYLRKIGVGKIDDSKYDLDLNDLYANYTNIIDDNFETTDLLKAFIKKTKKGRHFGYRFYMMKPREILVVLGESATNKIRNNEDLEQFAKKLISSGIWLMYKGENPPDGLLEFKTNTVYEHELLLDLTEGELEESADYGLLPDRRVENLKLVDELLKIEVDRFSAKDFKERVWENYAHNKKLDRVKIISISNNATYVFNYELNNSQSVGKTKKIEAYFLDHAQNWTEEKNRWLRKNGENYLDIYSNTNNIKLILSKANNFQAKEDIISYIKLCESIKNKMIIIDERVQEAAYSLKYKPQYATEKEKIPYYEWYLTTGIFVPSPDKKYELYPTFNLSGQSYEKSEVEKFVEELNKITQEDEVLEWQDNNTLKCRDIMFDNIKFFVIHLGVIEKCLQALGKNKDSEDDINQFVKEIIGQDSHIKPIIVSGRGQPPNVPKKDNMPFINFSSLAQYNIDYRNKYLLSELLFSSRKIN